MVELDIRNQQQVQKAVAIAIMRFGRIDVLVNNAGYPLLGRFEEVTAEQIEQQFATNVFGTSNVLRTVLPIMRQQRSGHIINTSSIAGVKAVANAVFYSASIFAVEAISLALLDEVAPFGIKVTAIEPGFFRTEFLSEHSTEYGTQLHDDYEALRNTKAFMSVADGQQQGSPAKLAQVVMPTLMAHLDEIKQHETLTRSTDY